MQTKLIVNRFAAKCRKCGQSIPVGQKVFWRKGYGAFHQHCPDEKKPTVPANRETFKETVIEFAQIRDTFLDAMKGKNPFKKNRERFENHAANWRSGERSWYGAKGSDMEAWLNRGFKVEGLRNISPALMPDRKRRRLIFTEDGEMQIDQMLSGSDFPFMEWEKRERKPGIRVNADVSFNSHVDHSVIADYTKWIAQCVSTIEELGIDPEVNIAMPVQDCYTTDSGTKRAHLIRVKRENEAVDFTQYSALFSPGGFRILGFTGIYLCAEKDNATARNSLGAAVTYPDWDIEWIPESRTLHIKAHNSPSEFPAMVMTDKFRELMNQLIT